MALAAGYLPTGLAVECLQALCAAGRFEEALEVVRSLPEEYRQAERVQILSGKIALELGNLGTVEQVLQREYAVIREGETELTDLWADLWLRREADQTGQKMDRSHRREILQKYPPPLRSTSGCFNRTAYVLLPEPGTDRNWMLKSKITSPAGYGEPVMPSSSEARYFWVRTTW